MFEYRPQVELSATPDQPWGLTKSPNGLLMAIMSFVKERMQLMSIRLIGSIILSTNLFVFGCSSTENDARIQFVSINSLIQDPNEYLGKRILVQGYLKSGINCLRLYFTRDHAYISDISNSILICTPQDVSILEKGCAYSYIEIIGTFNIVSNGHALTNIETVKKNTILNDENKLKLDICWSRNESDLRIEPVYMPLTLEPNEYPIKHVSNSEDNFDKQTSKERVSGPIKIPDGGSISGSTNTNPVN